MAEYLDFEKAECKDCYKCLRSCPVKAIEFKNHQAKIIKERCILCGRCTHVCPQNAKRVHSEKDIVENLLRSGKKVIASVAPSFVTSFGVKSFAIMKIALGKLGFYDSEETAIGARVVTDEYQRLLESGQYNNFITSACPSVDRMIQMYYPKALKYLAPVPSPMVAHARIIKAKYPTAEIVFIGPCIAKKREAEECGLIKGALTFEDLQSMFDSKGIIVSEIAEIGGINQGEKNSAKYYPINRGVIKSFAKKLDNYEYLAVDGLERCMEVLDNIDSLENTFLELNACEYACVNGPCKLKSNGGSIKANADIRDYVLRSSSKQTSVDTKGIDLTYKYARLKAPSIIITDKELEEILKKTGKNSIKDELNCGACGYSTCREKAWAVANGYADVEMCLPYMRARAESMSYEIIENSPNGIVAIDYDLKVIQINEVACKLWNVSKTMAHGALLVDLFDPTEFAIALSQKQNLYNKQIMINSTNKTIELTIIVLDNHKMLIGFMKDITAKADAENQIAKMRLDTIATTDEVIMKQMRVAQEIASLLGETTAETKVALLKLKSMVRPEEGEK